MAARIIAGICCAVNQLALANKATSLGPSVSTSMSFIISEINCHDTAIPPFPTLPCACSARNSTPTLLSPRLECLSYKEQQFSSTSGASFRVRLQARSSRLQTLCTSLPAAILGYPQNRELERPALLDSLLQPLLAGSVVSSRPATGVPVVFPQ
jgi:hypothetical protein